MSDWFDKFTPSVIESGGERLIRFTAYYPNRDCPWSPIIFDSVVRQGPGNVIAAREQMEAHLRMKSIDFTKLLRVERA